MGDHRVVSSDEVIAFVENLGRFVPYIVSFYVMMNFII